MNFIFTNKPSSHWYERCHNHGDLFNTPKWHEALTKGLGGRIIYGWDEASSTGLSITVFKAGPFKIGYLGFPVGGTVGGGPISPEMIEALKKADFPETMHCLRIPVSAFASNVVLSLPTKTTLETSIENLQEWKLKSSKTRCKINKAKRTPVRIEVADDPSRGEALFQIYRDVVFRNKGNMRYTSKYFERLIDLSITDPRVNCALATVNGGIIGFQVAACHGKTAYSLHGCTNSQFRHLGAADLLLSEAVNWAKQRGMECYNLMASPHEQLSLVHYKEKWGGVTRPQHTYDLALYPFQTMMFNFSSMLYEKIRFK